jgi:predicted secreted Zn-dependent protease
MTTAFDTAMALAATALAAAMLTARHYRRRRNAEAAAIWDRYVAERRSHQRTRAELAAANSELAALAACSDMTAGQALELTAALQCATQQAQDGPVVDIGENVLRRFVWN